MRSARHIRSAALCAAALAAAPAFGQSLRIMDAVDAVRTPTHIDVAVLFNCDVRYVTHSPASQGEEVHVRITLGDDCGTPHSETLPPPPDGEVVRSIELSALLANDVDVAVRWL